MHSLTERSAFQTFGQEFFELKGFFRRETCVDDFLQTVGDGIDGRSHGKSLVGEAYFYAPGGGDRSRAERIPAERGVGKGLYAREKGYCLFLFWRRSRSTMARRFMPTTRKMSMRAVPY